MAKRTNKYLYGWKFYLNYGQGIYRPWRADPMRYKLLQQGPDNRSTWAECFGPNPSSEGRLVAVTNCLRDLIDKIPDHDNWQIRSANKQIAWSRASFWALPTIAQELRRRESDG